MQFDWSNEKNQTLKSERGISFEEVVVAIATGNVLAVVKHPNSAKYPNQSMYIVQLNRYAYLVPFVDDGDIRFLKTIIPSRKATRDYLREAQNEL